MPEQDPAARQGNFDEVALGYTPEQAAAEASRCLLCAAKPCAAGCPVGVDIPAFIKKLALGDTDGALGIIREANALPAICGRVCPQETQCEALCVRGKKGESVAVGRLERYCADRGTVGLPKPSPIGLRAAVVGSGPAGLACAWELACGGADVTLYEAFHVCGGVLAYGIPPFRLPRAVTEREVALLRAMGVKIVTDFVVGRTKTVDGLLDGLHHAVFIGAGAGLPSFLGVPGEGFAGVYSANELLTRVNLMRAAEPGADTPVLDFGKAVVIGGGNVAIDAARVAKRLGAESVTVAYRRGRAEMPARLEEIHHAEEEGVEFRFLTAPVEITGDGEHRVTGIVCEEMRLGEPDASGRRRPEPVPHSRFTMECDIVVSAIGTSPNPLIGQATPDLQHDKYGCIVTDPATGRTSKKGVWAGGDISTGAATVILAMGAGKRAALSMLEDYRSRGS
jgi:glutamate synthase (NADPH/NADH) small chain